MAAQAAQQPAPYDVTVRAWRDEQPGDDARLLVSITFVPRASTERWQEVRIRTLEMRANGRHWSASESAVADRSDGGFELTAAGEATLPAGTKATIAVTLQTSAGEKQLELAVEIGRVG